MSENHFNIDGVSLPIVEYHTQRVVTLAMIDQAHQRPGGTASRNFQHNRDRFIPDEDFYLIDFSQNNVFRGFGIEVPPRGLTVFTESGYLMLAKSFTDDLAWKVQRRLVNGYFKAREQALPRSFADALQLAADQQRQIESQGKQIEQQQGQIEADRPKVEYTDRLLGTEQVVDMEGAAKILRTSRHRLMVFLKDREFLNLNNLPKQRYIDKDFARVHQTHYKDVFKRDQISLKTVLTQRGLAYVRAMLDTFNRGDGQ